MTSAGSSIKNGNLKRGKFKDLVFPNIIYKITYRMLSVYFGNDLL